MTTQTSAEATIQRVLNKLTAERVNNLAPDNGEFKAMADAIMAWYQLLIASGIVQKTPRAADVMASGLLVLGTLVKYAYALGRTRGRKDKQARRRNAV